MRLARPVVRSSDQQEILESRVGARSAPARSVERARIVLLAGAGCKMSRSRLSLRLHLRRQRAGGIGFWTAVLRRWTKMRRAPEERQRSHRPRCKR